MPTNVVVKESIPAQSLLVDMRKRFHVDIPDVLAPAEGQTVTQTIQGAVKAVPFFWTFHSVLSAFADQDADYYAQRRGAQAVEGAGDGDGDGGGATTAKTEEEEGELERKGTDDPDADVATLTQAARDADKALGSLPSYRAVVQEATPEVGSGATQDQQKAASYQSNMAKMAVNKSVVAFGIDPGRLTFTTTVLAEETRDRTYVFSPSVDFRVAAIRPISKGSSLYALTHPYNIQHYAEQQALRQAADDPDSFVAEPAPPLPDNPFGPNPRLAKHDKETHAVFAEGSQAGSMQFMLMTPFAAVYVRKYGMSQMVHVLDMRDLATGTAPTTRENMTSRTRWFTVDCVWPEAIPLSIAYDDVSISLFIQAGSQSDARKTCLANMWIPSTAEETRMLPCFPRSGGTAMVDTPANTAVVTHFRRTSNQTASHAFKVVAAIAARMHDVSAAIKPDASIRMMLFKLLGAACESGVEDMDEVPEENECGGMGPLDTDCRKVLTDVITLAIGHADPEGAGAYDSTRILLSLQSIPIKAHVDYLVSHLNANVLSNILTSLIAFFASGGCLHATSIKPAGCNFATYASGKALSFTRFLLRRAMALYLAKKARAPTGLEGPRPPAADSVGRATEAIVETALCQQSHADAKQRLKNPNAADIRPLTHLAARDDVTAAISPDGGCITFASFDEPGSTVIGTSDVMHQMVAFEGWSCDSFIYCSPVKGSSLKADFVVTGVGRGGRRIMVFRMYTPADCDDLDIMAIEVVTTTRIPDEESVEITFGAQAWTSIMDDGGVGPLFGAMATSTRLFMFREMPKEEEEEEGEGSTPSSYALYAWDAQPIGAFHVPSQLEVVIVQDRLTQRLTGFTFVGAKRIGLFTVFPVAPRVALVHDLPMQMNGSICCDAGRNGDLLVTANVPGHGIYMMDSGRDPCTAEGDARPHGTTEGNDTCTIPYTAKHTFVDTPSCAEDTTVPWYKALTTHQKQLCKACFAMFNGTIFEYAGSVAPSASAAILTGADEAAAASATTAVEAATTTTDDPAPVSPPPASSSDTAPVDSES